LATNGIDKPVLDLFRMLGLMGMTRGQRLKTDSSGRVPLETILSDGVRAAADVDAFAVRGDREVSVLSWNYHDDDMPPLLDGAKVTVEITGLPMAARRVLLRRYSIDDTHSNSWTAWKKMGSPQQPSAEQYAVLEAAGGLEQCESPRWLPVDEGAVKLYLTLPRQSVSLVQISW
jgi:xylan 1,4-beta-xylosidase